MGKIIGLTYNLKSDWKVSTTEPKDANAEFDRPETIDLIESALKEGGHTVKRIGDVKALLNQIDTLNVDIVFNLCEGRCGRNRESQVPLLLEMKGIPFVGADALTLGITLDKVISKKIFIAENIPSPRFFVVEHIEDLHHIDPTTYPLIVKTSQEGTSKGISEQSKVDNFDALTKRVKYIIETYRQPALVEEFIRGTEFTVAVLGNTPCEVMPIVQTTMDGQYDLGDKFYSNERVYNNTVEYVCPAPIERSLKEKIEELSHRVYKAFGCRDLGRIDFRVDKKGNPYVLEINPLPSLDEQDIFNIFPQTIGSTYADTLNKIIHYALERYGLNTSDTDKYEKTLSAIANP